MKELQMAVARNVCRSIEIVKDYVSLLGGVNNIKFCKSVKDLALGEWLQ